MNGYDNDAVINLRNGVVLDLKNLNGIPILIAFTFQNSSLKKIAILLLWIGKSWPTISTIIHRQPTRSQLDPWLAISLTFSLLKDWVSINFTLSVSVWELTLPEKLVLP